MPVPSKPVPSKDALRQRFRAERAALSEPAYAAKSRAIADRAAALDVLSEARRVHAYWPMTTDREVDTRPLIRRLRNQGTDVVLPVVTQYPPDPPAMEHRLFTGLEATTENRWGIPEPTGTPVIDPATLDAVLVPALGAGRNGHRIGHGTGYYDAFLAPLADRGVPRITLVYDTCLIDTVPADPHDVPITLIVTETTSLQIPSRQSQDLAS